jgi:translation initiation factor IF-2
VVTDTAKAKQIVMYREAKAREQAMAGRRASRSSSCTRNCEEGKVKELQCDPEGGRGGTAEVICRDAAEAFHREGAHPVLHAGVGGITENDVDAGHRLQRDHHRLQRASGSQRGGAGRAGEGGHPAALGHLRADRRDQAGHGRAAGAGVKEVYRGRAEVQADLPHRQGGYGGRLRGGGRRHLPGQRSASAARQRGGLHRADRSLKRYKDDVSEVKSGLECGVAIENFNDVKPGDVLEAFVREQVAAEVLVAGGKRCRAWACSPSR